ncbi:hypothetical protein LR48_Vigan454s000100 [Vigna angularis]|uniref:Uncharacterized protein n=1 Tax=Phaseolus angularis TaxID=3914 RepID=A0A0L9TAZ3_PHAAN|nr:hypothetical protein LR48_Vigan454s000100 [Vigna angularis]
MNPKAPVLFIFPSRYLFAIGLSPIFSLGRNLPPDWGCIPKQPDSPTAPRGATGSGHNGALTPSGTPFQGTWARSATEDPSPDYNSNAKGDRFSWWAVPGLVDFSPRRGQRTAHVAAIRTLHRTIQSVGATGGVYKGQGRSQRELGLLTATSADPWSASFMVETRTGSDRLRAPNFRS